MGTDTERLDWLERQFGCGLVHDDNEHWAVAAIGMQSVAEGDEPEDLETSFFVEKDKFKPTIREAIDAAMEGQGNG